MASVKVVLEAQIPAPEVEPMLQAIRGWEQGREGINVAIRIEHTTAPAEDVMAMAKRLNPELPFIVKFDRMSALPTAVGAHFTAVEVEAIMMALLIGAGSNAALGVLLEGEDPVKDPDRAMEQLFEEASDLDEEAIGALLEKIFGVPA